MSGQSAESIHEIRRHAPLHYSARADNSRYTAFLLTHLEEAESEKAKRALGYGGTSSIALYEAFRREAAISLELMLKAVIALRIERGMSTKRLLAVPLTHNIPALWRDAELPQLDKDGRLRLLYLKHVLIWLGRYPAPKDDASAAKEEEEIETTLNEPKTTGIRFHKVLPFGWKEFESLYSIASTAFGRLRQDFS